MPPSKRRKIIKPVFDLKHLPIEIIFTILQFLYQNHQLINIKVSNPSNPDLQIRRMIKEFKIDRTTLEVSGVNSIKKYPFLESVVITNKKEIEENLVVIDKSKLERPVDVVILDDLPIDLTDDNDDEDVIILDETSPLTDSSLLFNFKHQVCEQVKKLCIEGELKRYCSTFPNIVHLCYLTNQNTSLITLEFETLKLFPKLEHISFKGINCSKIFSNSLKFVELENCCIDDLEKVDTNKIEVLKIIKPKSVPSSFGISSSFQNFLLRDTGLVFPKLRILHLNFNTKFLLGNINAPELVELQLNNSENIVIDFNNCPNLKKLVIKNCKNVESITGIESLSKLESIEFIRICGLDNLDYLGESLNKLKHLKYIDLTNVAYFNGFATEYLNEFDNLQVLILHNQYFREDNKPSIRTIENFIRNNPKLLLFGFNHNLVNEKTSKKDFIFLELPKSQQDRSVLLDLLFPTHPQITRTEEKTKPASQLWPDFTFNPKDVYIKGRIQEEYQIKM